MSETINANGIAINYRFDGPEGAPVVMLSNSLGTNYTMWDKQIPALTENYRVLRYDTRGHGSTEVTPGAYTLDQLVEDAKGLLDALAIESVHFVGLSLGGIIAQQFAVKYPALLKSIALCDTSSLIGPMELWDGRIGTAESEGLEAMIGPTLERWLTKPFRDAHPGEVEKISAMFCNTDVAGFVGCSHAIRVTDNNPILVQISVPTIIIVGEDDGGTPVPMSEILHAGIPGSDLVVIQQAAHLSNVEQPEIFNETLLGFIGRNS